MYHSAENHFIQHYPIHSVYHIPFTSSIGCHLRPQVHKTIHFSNGSPYSITCIRSPLLYLEHLITLLLPIFTLNFLLSHTLPNSLTNLHKSSESATSAVSSANNSWFISNLPPFALSSSNPFPSTLTFTSRTTPSIDTLNNHGEITQPCLNPTLVVVVVVVVGFV